MSSKRNKQRNPNYSPATQNPQQKTTLSFEELQLRHLQVMVNHLANKAYLSVGKIDDELQKEALAPLRLYAQYLNLYMKFKDKCFAAETPNQTPQKANHSKSAPKINIKEDMNSLFPQIQNTDSHGNGAATPNRLQQASNTTALLVNPQNGSKLQDHKT